MAIYPIAHRLAKAFAAGSNALGVQVAILILPALLQQHIHLGVVLTLQGFLRAETTRIDFIALWHSHLIIEHQTSRALGIRDSHLHLSVWVLGAFDRLEHLSEENTARDEHIHVNHA